MLSPDDQAQFHCFSPLRLFGRLLCCAPFLEEAGIEMVFGVSGGHTGRFVSGLSKYQNSIRTVLVREESLGGVMVEVYGRLTRRPGALLGQGPWVLGNGLRGLPVELAGAIADRFQR
jgi:hypothetical protein